MNQNISAPLIASVIKTIPNEYLREMQGIATASMLTLDEIVMANVFYEITSVGKTPWDVSRSCTSLVAQRSNGTVYIARNQDYPPPFSLLMVHAIFQRANKTVYQGTTYAGFFEQMFFHVFAVVGRKRERGDEREMCLAY